MVGDVKGEGVVSASVLSRVLAVDIDAGFPVGCLEVEEYAFARPCVGNGNIPTIPETLVRAEDFHDAREGGVDGKGDEDLTLIGSRCAGGADGFEGVVPQAVEVLPVLAHHLRARVFWQGVVGGDVFRKRR